MYRTPLDRLRADHRSLAAVLHGMRFLVDDIEAKGTRPDFRVFRAMIYYIDTFSERRHHPAEDRYLLAALRGREHDTDAMLSHVAAEHVRGGHLIRALEQSLLRYEAGGAHEARGFRDAVHAYVDFHWKHMRFEEDELFPAAERALSASDWAALERGLTAFPDPLDGIAQEQEFDRLFSHIVAIAPPPIGVGPDA